MAAKYSTVAGLIAVIATNVSQARTGVHDRGAGPSGRSGRKACTSVSPAMPSSTATDRAVSTDDTGSSAVATAVPAVTATAAYIPSTVAAPSPAETPTRHDVRELSATIITATAPTGTAMA